MSVEAELSDGTVLEFPDGTHPDVVRQTVKRQLGLAGPAKPPAPAPLTPEEQAASRPASMTLTRGGQPVMQSAVKPVTAEPTGSVMDNYVAPPAPARQSVVRLPFDPAGSGYDRESASAAGLKPDATGHWPSRVPETGLILKGTAHETFSKTIDGERAAGMDLYKKDGRVYSRPQGSQAAEVERVLGAKYLTQPTPEEMVQNAMRAPKPEPETAPIMESVKAAPAIAVASTGQMMADLPRAVTNLDGRIEAMQKIRDDIAGRVAVGAPYVPPDYNRMEPSTDTYRGLYTKGRTYEEEIAQLDQQLGKMKQERDTSAGISQSFQRDIVDATPKNQGMGGKVLTSIAGSAVPTLGGLAAGMVAGPLVGAAVMGAPVYGQTYAKTIEHGDTARRIVPEFKAQPTPEAKERYIDSILQDKYADTPFATDAKRVKDTLAEIRDREQIGNISQSAARQMRERAFASFERNMTTIATNATAGAAVWGGIIDAALEITGERVGLGVILKQGTPALLRIFHSLVAEGGQEIVTQIGQTLRQILAYDPTITFKQALEQVAIAGLAGAAMGGPMGAVGAVADRSREQYDKKQAGKDLFSAVEGAQFRPEATDARVRASMDPSQAQREVVSRPAPPARATPGTMGDLAAVMADPRPLEEIRAEQAAQATEEAAPAVQAVAQAAVERAAAEQERVAAASDAVGVPAEGEFGIMTRYDGTTARVQILSRTEDGATVLNPEGDIEEVAYSDTKFAPDALGENTPAAPVVVEAPVHVEQAVERIEPAPTEAQKEAGNYAKAHIELQGLQISLENAKGSERTGTDSDGETWSTTMPAHYGYVKRTEGADGDQVDVYVGDTPESQQVWVVDQIDPATGKFDEHKVMLGFPTAMQAKATYFRGFSDASGNKRLGAMTHMPMAQFKEWLKTGDNTKPVAYVQQKETENAVPTVPEGKQETPTGEQPAAEAGTEVGPVNEEGKAGTGGPAGDNGVPQQALDDRYNETATGPGSGRWPAERAEETVLLDEDVYQRIVRPRLREEYRKSWGKSRARYLKGHGRNPNDRVMVRLFPSTIGNRLPEYRISEESAPAAPPPKKPVTPQVPAMPGMTPIGAAPEGGKLATPALQLEALQKKLILFSSGMNRTAEISTSGWAAGGQQTRGIGVAIKEVSKPGIEQLAAEILDHNARVFVDSGAYSKFTAGIREGLAPNEIDPLPFDLIMAKYDFLLETIQARNDVEETGYPRPLLVMPDSVGRQALSLDLLRRYKADVLAHITFNVSDPIVPIQRGELTLAEAYREAVSILGTDNFIVGIPGAKEAITQDEFLAFVREIRPKKIHILGAAAGSRLDPYLEALALAKMAGELTHLSADASTGIRNSEKGQGKDERHYKIAKSVMSMRELAETEGISIEEAQYWFDRTMGRGDKNKDLLTPPAEPELQEDWGVFKEDDGSYTYAGPDGERGTGYFTKKEATAAAVERIGERPPVRPDQDWAPKAEPKAADAASVSADDFASMMDDVEAELAPKTEAVVSETLRPATGGEPYGLNYLGQTIYRDGRGVRSIVVDGERISQPSKLVKKKYFVHGKETIFDEAEPLAEDKRFVVVSDQNAPRAPGHEFKVGEHVIYWEKNYPNGHKPIEGKIKKLEGISATVHTVGRTGLEMDNFTTIYDMEPYKEGVIPFQEPPEKKIPQNQQRFDDRVRMNQSAEHEAKIATDNGQAEWAKRLLESTRGTKFDMKKARKTLADWQAFRERESKAGWTASNPNPGGYVAPSPAADLKAAAEHTIEGVKKGFDALDELFGTPGKLGMGPSFDEETWKKAKPALDQAYAEFVAAGKALRDFVKHVMAKYGAKIRPYLERWHNELSQRAGRGEDTAAGPGVPGGGEPGRGPGAVGTPAVEPGKPEDGGAPGKTGDTGGAGGGVRGPEAKAGGEVPQGGDVGAGLGGAGVGGNAPTGTGATGPAVPGAGPGAGPVVPGNGPVAGGVPPNAPTIPVAVPKKNLANFHIDDPERLIGGGGPKARFAKNRAAIDAYNAAISEHRDPTTKEREAMAGYIGWGSFGQELFQGTWQRSYSPDGWKAEDKWLRDHLGQEQWESAQTSILNAHYTDPPTVTTIWDMIRAMGFKGGRVLEPSMGIGNFYGLMPRDLMEKSQLAGIEKDQLSGSMAQMMYPDANVQIKGYEESQTADNFYDLIVGNWPFAAQGPIDRRYHQLSASLHDYFFVKALDQVRPGGLVVGITSAGTMDKMGRNIRLELARKGELVAAFRLPSGAFEKYAGTAVVTDLIILRKRDKPASDTLAAGWIESVKHRVGGNDINLNEYYVANPENILGKLNWGHGTTSGRPGMIVDRQKDFPQQLATLPTRVPKGAFKTRKEARGLDYSANTTKERENTILVHPTTGELSVVRGEYLAPLDQIQKWKGKVASANAKMEAEIKALIGLRTAYSTLIKAESEGTGDIEAARTDLRTKYAAYNHTYGRINRYGGPVTKLFEKVRDPHTVRLMALESNKGDKKVPKWEPAKIMFESTMRKSAHVDKPSVADAFAMTRNEGVDVDPERIAALANTTPEAVIKELGDLGAIWKTPAGTWEVTDVYLSGNVRRKLREAQAAAKEGQDMARNIEALTKVLPETTPYYLIEAKLGAPWVGIPPYQAFAAELLGITETDGIDIQFRLGSWHIQFTDHGLNRRPEAQTLWGTDYYPFNRIMQAAFNNLGITITYEDQNGVKHTDDARTAEVNEKRIRLREEFSTWAWKENKRRIELETNFNETMNAIADAKYDGSFMSMTGMSLTRGDDPLSLRKHQMDAIWRGLVNKRGIYAHEVGTGKTYTMGGIAVESRRLGIARKTLIFAHNANSKDVAASIQQMYPAAAVLYVDNLSPETVNLTLQQIANDDWDAIVVPHSLVDRFALKEATLNEIAAEQITQMEEEAILAAADDNVHLDVGMMDDPDAMKRVRSPTAKELVKARNAILASIQKMALLSSKEGAVAFEDLGIDQILIDEVQSFKKPPLATKMRIKGLNTATSNRSISINFITSYVKRLNGGAGIHVFTGTPITNTLNEIYNLQRMVADDVMEKDGIKQWDSWFNTFADSGTDVELTPAGEYEAITRLASFVNVAELRRMISQYTDIVFADDMPEFKPRESKSGKTMKTDGITEAEKVELTEGRSDDPIGRPYKRIINDVGQLGPRQLEILQQLVVYANDWKNARPKDRYDWRRAGDPRSPILVETAAANAGLDARMQDLAAPDEAGNKESRVVKNVLEIFHSHPLANQAIFVDRGYTDERISRKAIPGHPGRYTITRRPGFNLVKSMKAKLVAGGIPEHQIAIVNGEVSKEKRLQISDDMNTGKIRVVIGLSSTLGVGVNMQDNLRAMHHMDAPWTPGDLEQRNGRGWRQGNHWNTVLEYRYITERLDGRRWQVLSIKDRFIKAFLKADKSVRIIDGDAADMTEDDAFSDLAESLSEAAGDPRILQREKLRTDIEKLERRERAHVYGAEDAGSQAGMLEHDLEEGQKHLSMYKIDVATLKATEDAPFTIELQGTPYTDRKAATEALDKIVKGLESTSRWQDLGTFRGFPMSIRYPFKGADVEVQLRSTQDEIPNWNWSPTYLAKPTVASIEAIMRNVEGTHVNHWEKKIADITESIPRMRAAQKAPFSQQEKLDKKRQAMADLAHDLEINPVPPPSWLRHGAPVGTTVYVGNTEYVVEGHVFMPDTYGLIVSIEGKPDRTIPYDKVTDENGLPKYEAHPFDRPTPIRRVSVGTVMNEKGTAEKWRVLRGPYNQVAQAGQPPVQLVFAERISDSTQHEKRVDELEFEPIPEPVAVAPWWNMADPIDTIYGEIPGTTPTEPFDAVYSAGETTSIDPRVADKVREIARQIAPMANLAVVDVHFGSGPNLLKSGAKSAARRMVPGSYQAARELMTVALNAKDPTKTIRHEGVHALYGMGMFTPAEWTVLTREAEKRWMKQFDVTDAEESIGYAFEFYDGPRAVGGLVGKAFARIRDFLTRLGNALRGLGFNSVESIFASIEAGTVGGSVRPGSMAGLERGQAGDIAKARYSARARRVLGTVPQAISSAATERRQVPASMKAIPWVRGQTNLDIGSGKFGDAGAYLQSKGVTNLAYDPFNRTEEQNVAALEKVIEGGGTDTVTVANVLNVIQEPGARNNVVRRAAKAVKEGGTAYFQIYEGEADGKGAETRDGWQENRRTQTYVPEIAKHFENVTRSGQIIMATGPKRSAVKWRNQSDDIVFSAEEVKAAPGVPTVVMGVEDQVTGRERMAPPEVSVEHAKKIFDEVGLYVVPRGTGLWDVENKTLEEGALDPAGQRLLEALRREIRNQGNNAESSHIASLITSVAEYIASDENVGMSLPLRTKLYGVAQGERSHRGLLLGELAQVERDTLQRLSRNVEGALERVYAEHFGGGDWGAGKNDGTGAIEGTQEILDEILKEVRARFTDAELRQILDMGGAGQGPGLGAGNGPGAGPGMGPGEGPGLGPGMGPGLGGGSVSAEELATLVDQLAEATLRENGGRLYRKIEALYKKKSPKTLDSLNESARINEAAQKIIEDLRQEGIEPKERPGKQKLTPIESLMLMVNPETAGRIDERIAEAIAQAERNAGIKATMDEADPADRATLMQEFDAGLQPTAEMIEQGMELEKFAHWRVLRETLLEYSPTTLKLVHQVLRGEFKGIRPIEAKPPKAPDTRIDLAKLARAPEQEVHRVLDAHMQAIEDEMDLSGATPETLARVSAMIQRQVTADLEAAREKVRNKIMSPAAAKRAAMHKQDALSEWFNARLLEDPRMGIEAEVARVAAKSRVRRLLPTMGDLVKKVFSTPFFRQSELENRFGRQLSLAFGLPETQRKVAEELFRKAFEEKFTQAKAKALEKVKKSLTPKQQKTIRKLPKLWERINQAVNAGVFDSVTVMQNIAQARGWTVPTARELIEIRTLSYKEQKLRELTNAERATAERSGNVRDAESDREAATLTERAHLKRQAQALWLRWTAPLGWRTAEQRRNVARAINEVTSANLLLRPGFFVRQFIDVATQTAVFTPTRAVASALQIYRADKSAGRETRLWRDAGNALRDAYVQRAKALRAAMSAAKRGMAGRSETKNVEAILDNISIFDRSELRAAELAATGKTAQAFMLRMANYFAFAFHFSKAMDDLQGTLAEAQEMQARTVRELREHGLTPEEAQKQAAWVMGDTRLEFLAAVARAQQLMETSGMDATPALVNQAAWEVVKARQYARIEALKLPADDFRAHNRLLRNVIGWNEREYGGFGGVIAGLGRSVTELFEGLGLPMPIARFSNAVGIGINRALTWTPMGFFPAAFKGRRGSEWMDSPWFTGEENQTQRKIEAAIGSTMGLTVMALVAAGLMIPRFKWPENEAERDLWRRIGRQPGTVEIKTGKDSFITVSMTVGPLALVRPYLVFLGSIMDSLAKQEEQVKKLKRKAEEAGLQPAMAEKKKADILAAAASAAYSTFLGGRTAAGLITNITDNRAPQIGRSIAGTVAPLIPGAPQWQEWSRMQGVQLDPKKAEFLDFLFPTAGTEAEKRNFFGDPLNEDTAARVAKVLTGGTYPYASTPISKNTERAYQILGETGWRPPALQNQAHEIGDQWRVFDPEEFAAYQKLRGPALKKAILEADLTGLTPNEKLDTLDEAAQDANEQAKDDVIEWIEHRTGGTGASKKIPVITQ